MNDFIYIEKPNSKLLALSNSELSDLHFGYCGLEKHPDLSGFGPDSRDDYLIHYILDGEGIYCVNNKKYSLKKGQGFVIYPDQLTYYKPEKNNPWTYIWLGFNGKMAEIYLEQSNISKANPIFTLDNTAILGDCVLKMLSHRNMSQYDQLSLHALTYTFLANLSTVNADNLNPSQESNHNIYIEKAVKFIEDNYHKDIKINEIANYLGLNRSYFATLFRQAYNMSPQEFLLNYRVNRANTLLINSNLSVKEISNSVGYDDQLTFSRIYKKITGLSPTIYRKNLTTSNKSE